MIKTNNLVIVVVIVLLAIQHIESIDNLETRIRHLEKRWKEEINTNNLTKIETELRKLKIYSKMLKTMEIKG